MLSGKGDHLAPLTTTSSPCAGMYGRTPDLSPHVDMNSPPMPSLTCHSRSAYYIKNNFNGGTETFA